MKYFSVLFCVPLCVLLLSAILSGVCLSRFRKWWPPWGRTDGGRPRSTPWPQGGSVLLLAGTRFWNQIHCIHIICMEYDGPIVSVKCSASRRCGPNGVPGPARPARNLPFRVMHSKSTFILAVRHKGASVYSL